MGTILPAIGSFATRGQHQSSCTESNHRMQFFSASNSFQRQKEIDLQPLYSFFLPIPKAVSICFPHMLWYHLLLLVVERCISGDAEPC